MLKNISNEVVQIAKKILVGTGYVGGELVDKFLIKGRIVVKPVED